MTHRYPEVRALTRGLQIISALADLGPSLPARLAIETGIDRTTVYRLLHTLELNGFVHTQGESLYALSDRFAEIATGITYGDRYTHIAVPLLEELTRKSGWPCDFAVWSGGAMQIRASTHHLTTMTFFRRLVGKSRPLLTTSLGQAFLAAVGPDKRAAIIAQAAELDGWDPAVERARIEASIQQTRKQGYAAGISSYDPKISAIALPVMNGAAPIGALNLVFFRSAMPVEKAAAAYLDDLRAIAHAIAIEAACGQPGQ